MTLPWFCYLSYSHTLGLKKNPGSPAVCMDGLFLRCHPPTPPPPSPRRIVGSGGRLRGGLSGSRHGAAAGKTLAPYPAPGDSAPSGTRHSGPDRGLSPPAPPSRASRPPWMPGSRGRTLGLGTPPRLPPGLGWPWAGVRVSPPGAQVSGARPRPRPGLFPGAAV